MLYEKNNNLAKCFSHYYIYTMMMPPGLPKLCAPAHVYFVISIIILVLMGLQNRGNNHNYCLGNYSCATSNTTFIFFVKLLYVIFWTWVLNLICKSGASIVSWVLVMLPILVMFILIGVYMIEGKTDLIKFTQSGIT